MKQLFKKSFRVTALVMVFCFASTLIASPAFSRGRGYYHSRCYRGSHHVRVYHDGGVLPALIATGIIAGITYSIIDNATRPPVTDYRAETRTYTPAVPPNPYSATVSADSVMVTAQLLNVRTGPSLGTPSIRQIPYGTVLSIYDRSPGWYYVNLSGNQYGWVMAQFTEPVGRSGDG